MVALTTIVAVVAAGGSVFMAFDNQPSPNERHDRPQRIPGEEMTRPGWSRAPPPPTPLHQSGRVAGYPLDGVTLDRFKLAVGRQHQELRPAAAVPLVTDMALNLKLVVEAEQAALRSATIKQCWMNTGLSTKADASQMDEEDVLKVARRSPKSRLNRPCRPPNG